MLFVGINPQEVVSGEVDFREMKLQLRNDSKSGQLYNFTALVVGDQLPQPAKLVVPIRGCIWGEEPLNASCNACSESRFSFDGSKLCRTCPKGALCPGSGVQCMDCRGTILLPKPGYWHSNAVSLHMHKCVNEEACTGANDDFDEQSAAFCKDYSHTISSSYAGKKATCSNRIARLWAC